MTKLFRRVPAGVGSKGFVSLNHASLKRSLKKGARWCVEQGYGWADDVTRIEERGCIAGADPSKVSDRAVERGINQLGTLGSGNHCLEVQVAANDRIFDRETAVALGISGHDQIVIMVHCGSRGFEHQVASDYLKVFEKAMRRHGIAVKDQQLACAPFRSRVATTQAMNDTFGSTMHGSGRTMSRAQANAAFVASNSKQQWPNVASSSKRSPCQAWQKKPTWPIRIFQMWRKPCKKPASPRKWLNSGQFAILKGSKSQE